MRKVLSILLALLLLFAFVSCDELDIEKDPENGGGGSSQPGTGEGGSGGDSGQHNPSVLYLDHQFILLLKGAAM